MVQIKVDFVFSGLKIESAVVFYFETNELSFAYIRLCIEYESTVRTLESFM